MTFVRAVHLGLMFPLGIASFVFLVVTLAVGGSLIWTLIGPIVLLVGLYISRWFNDLEAWRVRHVAGIELRRPPTGIERGQSFRQQVKTRLIDPSTWTGLVYLLIQFPIGIAAFVLLVAGGAASGAFLVAPFFATFVGENDFNEVMRVSIDLGFWSTELTEPSEIAIALVPLGLVIYFLLVHAINIVTAVHASWARLMLGSRAEPIPLGPAEAPRPPTDGPPPPGSEFDALEAELLVAGNSAVAALDEPAPAVDPPAEPDTVEGPPSTPAPPRAEPAPAPDIEAPPTIREPDGIAATSGSAVMTAEAARPPDLESEAAAPTVVAPPLRLTPSPPPLASVPLSPANELVPVLDAPLLVATGEPFDALTTRELEVLTLIARGYSNAAIAETFVISEGTVKTHVKRVLSKLGLRDRTQAAIYAYETSFVAARSHEVAVEPIVLTRAR